MALVTTLKPQILERYLQHNEVECTYTIVQNDDGKFLQIDTYGSANRQIKSKKSQSIRLSENAIEELKKIIKNFESV